ncbi:MFS transporter [Nocardia sp. NPDC006630]|uniref:MFS transporter n=1 Tax=Nocardia sp. NPDC006630 TaxID=3157181 RepID=UPI0033B6A775
MATTAGAVLGQTKRQVEGAPTRPGVVLFIVCTAIFMLMLDATVVSAALADIRSDFDSSIDGLQWVIDAYALPLAGLLLTLGTAGDRFGRKRVFLCGMAVFTGASLALVLSGTIVQLNALRAVQGIGAAMLFATALPLLAAAYPDARARAKAIGIYSAVMAGATVAGPVFGGALVTAFGWRSIFTINVPIGVVIFALALRRLPETPRHPDRRTDWLGSILLSGGLLAGVLGLTRGNALGWTSPTIWMLAAASAVLLTLFMVWQFRAAHPLFDVSMLRKPGFAPIAIVAVAHMATLMAASNYLAIFLINTMGFTPLQMGVRLVPLSIAALIAAPLGAVLAKRIPTAVSLPITMGLVVLGMWLLGGVESTDSWTHFVPGMLIGGAGLGAITTVNQAAALTFASDENAGMASATFGTLRQVGMAVGVAGLGAMFSHRARDAAAHGLDAIQSARNVTVTPDLRAQFLDGVAAGGGTTVVHAVPPEFASATPLLTGTAHAASIEGLNALFTLGTDTALASTIAAAIFFAAGKWFATRP